MSHGPRRRARSSRRISRLFPRSRPSPGSRAESHRPGSKGGREIHRVARRSRRAIGLLSFSASEPFGSWICPTLICPGFADSPSQVLQCCFQILVWLKGEHKKMWGSNAACSLVSARPAGARVLIIALSKRDPRSLPTKPHAPTSQARPVRMGNVEPSHLVV